MTEDGQAVSRQICSEIPLMEWSLDADSHYLKIQEYLSNAIAEKFPEHKPQRAQSFFTDATGQRLSSLASQADGKAACQGQES